VNVVLLGVGAVGAVIARHLARHPAITGLTLADRAPARALGLAAELEAATAGVRGPGAAQRIVEADAGDPGALAGLLRGHDIVVNAVLPRFNGAVMDAALAAGCHYVDLAAGAEDQFRRGPAWRDAGRIALHGMGEDPGISNVLARRGADGLDAVDAVRVRDGEFSVSDDLPLACLFSIETFIEEAVSPGRVFANGDWRTLAPWSGREIYPFPEPVGPQPVYTMTHEEIDTLPRFLGKGVAYVDFKLAVPDAMREALTFLDRVGMTRRDTVDAGGVRVRPLAVLAAVLPQPADLGGNVRGAAIVLVEVEGRRAGRRVVQVLHAAMTHEEAYRLAGATATAYLTGTGGATGALAIATGRITAPGVHSPEQIDPAPLLEILGTLGVRVHETSRGFDA
jgi:saccharopine dehydrogenase (NAD+, L-lysine-forming)